MIADSLVGYIDRHGDGYIWVPAAYQLNLA